MNEIQNYDDAVEIIKTAILQSQYDAARSVNEKQLTLYYGIKATDALLRHRQIYLLEFAQRLLGQRCD